MQNNPRIADKILFGIDNNPKPKGSVAAKIMEGIDSSISDKILQGIDHHTAPPAVKHIENPSRMRAKYVGRQRDFGVEYDVSYYDNKSWAHVISRAVQNTPRDSRKVARETLEMFKNPIQTADVLGQLAAEGLIIKPFETALKMSPSFVGGYLRELNRRTPLLDNKPIVGKSSATPIFDTMWEFYENAYGFGDHGIAGMKHYIAEHPAEFLGDVASVLTLATKGAGAGLKGATVFNRNKMLQNLMHNSKFLDYLPEDKRTSIRNMSESDIIKHFEQNPSLQKYLPENAQKSIERSAKLQRASDSAYYIGTGAKGTGYKPGLWQKIAFNTLQYIDVGALPMIGGGQVVSGTLGLTAANKKPSVNSSDLNEITLYLYNKYKNEFPPELIKTDNESIIQSIMDEIKKDIQENDAGIVNILENRRKHPEFSERDRMDASRYDESIREHEQILEHPDEWWENEDNFHSISDDFVETNFDDWPDHMQDSILEKRIDDLYEEYRNGLDDETAWEHAAADAEIQLSDEYGFGVDPVEHVKAYVIYSLESLRERKKHILNQTEYRTNRYYADMAEKSKVGPGGPTRQQIEMWDSDPEIFYRIGNMGESRRFTSSESDIAMIEKRIAHYKELGDPESLEIAKNLDNILKDWRFAPEHLAFQANTGMAAEGYKHIHDAWLNRDPDDPNQKIYVVRARQRDVGEGEDRRLVTPVGKFAEIDPEFLNDPDNFRKIALRKAAEAVYENEHEYKVVFDKSERTREIFRDVLKNRFNFEQAKNPHEVADFAIKNYAKFLHDNFRDIIKNTPSVKNMPLAGDFHKNFINTWNEITKRKRRSVLADVEKLSDAMDAPVEIVKVEPEKFYSSRYKGHNSKVGQHGLTAEIIRKIKDDLGIPQLPDNVAPLANLETGNFYEVFDYSLTREHKNSSVAQMAQYVWDHQRNNYNPEQIEASLQRMLDSGDARNYYYSNSMDDLKELYKKAEVALEEVKEKFKNDPPLRYKHRSGMDRWYVEDNIPAVDGTDTYIQKFIIDEHRDWLYERLGVNTDAEVLALLKRYHIYKSHKNKAEKLGNKNIYFRVEDWHDNILENPVSVETSPGFWGTKWGPGHEYYGRSRDEYLRMAMGDFNEYAYKKRGGAMERFRNIRDFDEYLKNHKVYQFLEDGHAGPGVYMRGVNSLQSLEDLAEYYIRHAWGDDSYRSLVVFQGKKLGENLQKDGVVVQPEKVLKKYIFDFGENFRELQKDLSEVNPSSHYIYERDIGFGDVFRYSMPQQTRRLVYEIDNLMQTIEQKQVLFDEYNAIRDEYRSAAARRGVSDEQRQQIQDDAFRRMTEVYEQIADQYDVSMNSMVELENKLNTLLNQSLEIDPESRRYLRALVDSLHKDIYSNIDASISENFMFEDNMPLLQEFQVVDPETQRIVSQSLENAESSARTQSIDPTSVLTGSRSVSADELDNVFDELIGTDTESDALLSDMEDLFNELTESQDDIERPIAGAETKIIPKLEVIEPAIDQLPYATRFDVNGNILHGNEFRDIRDGEIYRYSPNGIHVPVQLLSGTNNLGYLWEISDRNNSPPVMNLVEKIKSTNEYRELVSTMSMDQLENAIINHYSQKALQEWNSVWLDPTTTPEIAQNRYLNIMKVLRSKLYGFVSDDKKNRVSDIMNKFENDKISIQNESKAIQYGNDMLATAFEETYLDSVKDYIDNFKYADPDQRSAIGKILLDESIMPDEELYRYSGASNPTTSGILYYFRGGKQPERVNINKMDFLDNFDEYDQDVKDEIYNLAENMWAEIDSDNVPDELTDVEVLEMIDSAWYDGDITEDIQKHLSAGAVRKINKKINSHYGVGESNKIDKQMIFDLLRDQDDVSYEISKHYEHEHQEYRFPPNWDDTITYHKVDALPDDTDFREVLPQSTLDMIDAKIYQDSESVKALKFAAIEELFSADDLVAKIEQVGVARMEKLFGDDVTDDIILISKVLRSPQGQDSVGFVQNATKPGTILNNAISGSFNLIDLLGHGDEAIGGIHLIFNMLGNQQVLEMLDQKGVMRDLLKNIDPEDVNRVRRWVYQYRGWLRRGYSRTKEEESK